MVLAQEKYAQQVETLPKTNRVIKKDSSRWLKPSTAFVVKVAVVSSILLAFSLGIFLTAQYAKIAAAGFAINQLKAEIASLETTNQRLHLAILQKQSLERVEYLAINKLGMVYAEPAERQQLAIHRDNPTTQPWFLAQSQSTENVILIEQHGRQMNPVIQAISQVIRLNN